MIWGSIDEHVGRLLAGATSKAVIVAPFIKARMLDRLLERMTPGIGITVFTRWQAEEVAAGVSDPAILETLSPRGAELRLCDALHAKLYLADGRKALIGSANVTAAAFGLTARPNIELLQPAELDPPAIALFIAQLRLQSRLATEDEMNAVLEAAAAIRVSPPPSFPAADAEPEGCRAAWLPSFRSPDRLFGLAKDADWLETAGSDEPALADLIHLAPVPTSSEADFDAYVRDRLRLVPLVRALDGFLAEPRRFGAVVDWLRQGLPDLDHRDRQARAQTLIRWLNYFDEGRYEVNTPNYSEILSLRPSG